MRDALNKTGRPIFYSICNWGEEDTASWGPKTGNSWRTTGDIDDSFFSMWKNFMLNQVSNKAAAPGGWNDPDMLEVGVQKDGKNGLSIHEEQTHFALWSITKAPLIIGADLRNIKNESLEILMNRELIAVNQDPLSLQAECFGVEGCIGPVGSYVTTLANGAKVIVVTNWTPTAWSEYFFTLNDLGLTLQKGQRAIIRDLYNADFEDSLELDYEPFFVGKLEKHQSRVLKIQLDRIQEDDKVGIF